MSREQLGGGSEGQALGRADLDDGGHGQDVGLRRLGRESDEVGAQGGEGGAFGVSDLDLERIDAGLSEPDSVGSALGAPDR